jgi:hypothetical protein
MAGVLEDATDPIGERRIRAGPADEEIRLPLQSADPNPDRRPLRLDRKYTPPAQLVHRTGRPRFSTGRSRHGRNVPCEHRVSVATRDAAKYRTNPKALKTAGL